MTELICLDAPTAARYLGCSVRALENFRTRGDGPIFVKLGRRVVYRQQDLADFLTERAVRSTAEARARDIA